MRAFTKIGHAAIAGLAAVCMPALCVAQEVEEPVDGHTHHSMSMDSRGMVMNSNTDRLPRDCNQISRDHEIMVSAGTEYAAEGMIFGLSEHEHIVDPCSRVTVTFVNNDSVRHQWMVHGLPKYLYPGGMFHLEAAGEESRTGTFIVPSDDRTYLVHCDLAQHMEKGMKGQLKVGRGSGDLWSVPTVSREYRREFYLPTGMPGWMLLAAVLGALLALALTYRRRKPIQG